MKVINYKEERDKALGYMVEFSKLGDKKMADEMLKLAVHINRLRTEIEPVITSDSII